MQDKIIVIGAGVIGASSALALQKEGHDVMLIDREAPCAGASFGNAGAIVNGSCVPTAMPGIVFDAIQMLTDKNAALSIRPSYFFKILPWLLRFILQSRATKVNKNSKNLHALTNQAIKHWRELTDNTKLSSQFRETGWMKVYELESTFAGSAAARELLDETATPYEILSADEIVDLEPNLAPIYQQAFYQKDSLSIVNPKSLVEGLVALFVEDGGSYRQFSVDNIEIKNNNILLKNTAEEILADKLVIAAGAWSRQLAKQLGDNIPLDTERGYHLMFPESTANLLSRPIVNSELSFVLCPMSEGLRMTSQVELGGLDLPPDYQRIRRLMPEAKRMLPKLNTTEKSAWMGFRPSLPDSLPVLGYSSRSDKVIYAFGHHHLGMTLGAVTASIVTDLVASRESAIPLTPYRPKRFNQL